MEATVTYPLDCGRHHVLDLDADEFGNYIALLSTGEVWTNEQRVPLRQRFTSAYIRQVDADRFVIVEIRRRSRNNAFVFDVTGRKLLDFDAGDAVADVLVQAGQIVISYFDEAAGSTGPGADGLAVFDATGRQTFGLNAQHPGFVLDCYALCKLGADSVLAYTYTGFPLVELRLTDYRLLTQPTPPDVAGAHELTTSYSNVVFYGSYAESARFCWWDRKTNVKPFGHLPTAGLRGIGAGKFLTFDARSFTIIDAMALMQQEHRQR
ncbi:hypothetical protein [Hymenobacter sp. CRA2]|uniref:hypothetical protein n=1 Tax=Hymenobacter sp. CRA2 TaxID=1955620 RepID=UPI00098F04CD|nr:hypothetical protein [Hymenobacter sp. CRA2]OON65874.1 hypothetical protein B0919_22870 [Hymenobacter sp. CRA2]